MQPSEITELWRRIAADYPSAKPYSPLAMQSWAEDLFDYSPEQVNNAYRAWRRAGNHFPPSVGDITTLCQPPVLTYGEVSAILASAISAHGRYDRAGMERELSRHRGVWEWVQACGGIEAVLNGGPNEEPINEGVWLAECEHRWKEVATALEHGRPLPALTGHDRAPQLPGQPTGLVGVGDVLGGLKA